MGLCPLLGNLSLTVFFLNFLEPFNLITHENQFFIGVFKNKFV